MIYVDILLLLYTEACNLKNDSLNKNVIIFLNLNKM